MSILDDEDEAVLVFKPDYNLKGYSEVMSSCLNGSCFRKKCIRFKQSVEHFGLLKQIPINYELARKLLQKYHYSINLEKASDLELLRNMQIEYERGKSIFKGKNKFL